MIQKYIRGNKNRGTEVMKALEELGGKNELHYNGEADNGFYYINEHNEIDVLYESSTFGKFIQECFEEIKLPKQLNIVIKEPKQIYWFRATEDDDKNQALTHKLAELLGHSNISFMTSRKSRIYFNEYDRIVCYDIESGLSRMAMMVGKELVIEQ